MWDPVANRSVICEEYLNFRRQLARIYQRVAFDEDPIIFRPDSTSTKVDELLFCRAHPQAKVVQFPFDKIQYSCEGVVARDRKGRGGVPPQDARTAAERAHRLEDEARRAGAGERETAEARVPARREYSRNGSRNFGRSARGRRPKHERARRKRQKRRPGGERPRPRRQKPKRATRPHKWKVAGSGSRD